MRICLCICLVCRWNGSTERNGPPRTNRIFKLNVLGELHKQACLCCVYAWSESRLTAVQRLPPYMMTVKRQRLTLRMYSDDALPCLSLYDKLCTALRHCYPWRGQMCVLVRVSMAERCILFRAPWYGSIRLYRRAEEHAVKSESELWLRLGMSHSLIGNFGARIFCLLGQFCCAMASCMPLWAKLFQIRVWFWMQAGDGGRLRLATDESFQVEYLLLLFLLDGRKGHRRTATTVLMLFSILYLYNSVCVACGLVHTCVNVAHACYVTEMSSGGSYRLSGFGRMELGLFLLWKKEILQYFIREEHFLRDKNKT